MKKYIIIALTLLFRPTSAVPPSKPIIEGKRYPSNWTGIWYSSRAGSEFTISPEIFGDVPEKIEDISTSDSEFKIITHLDSENCRRCRIVQMYHQNIIKFQVSQCLQKLNFEKLCGKAKTGNPEFLFRTDAVPQSPCPSKTLASSWKSYYEITYDEFMNEDSIASYVEGCGQPRSELSSCSRRTQDDPQFTINLGSCPSSSLVHRQSLTQNLQCIGSWTDESGTEYVVVKGFEYEYWTEGHYTSNSVFRCLAISADQQGDTIKMSQGFGSDCQGLGSRLSPENGQRRLTLTKVDLELGECNFPDWVTSTRVWNVIPRAGLRLDSSGESSSTRKVVFPDKLTFMLASKEEGGGQRFRCAKILNQSSNEVTLETFTQSQCYREYHCFHAKLNAEAGLVDLHVGSPVPNVEHACIKPSFDIDVPFLLATLMPVAKDGTTGPKIKIPTQSASQQQQQHQQRRQQFDPSAARDREIQESTSSSVLSEPVSNAREENLSKIRSHAISLLRQYESEHAKKVEELINGILHQLKLLYEDD